MEKANGLTSLRTMRGRRSAKRVHQTLVRALSAGHEHPEKWRERLGETTEARPLGPLIWFHAANEQAAADFPQLIDRMRLERDDVHFLVTIRLYDALNPLQSRLPDECIYQYLPYEEGPGMKAFLDHWQPDVCIWSDNNLAAVQIAAIAAQNVPLFYLEASMPDEKMYKLRWFPGETRKTLSCFEHVLAIDGRSERNLQQLGVQAEKIEAKGYLHEASPPLECAQSERDAMAELLSARPIWLAAGISREEEPAILSAHKAVSRRSHRLLLILAPSDPVHGPDLAKMLEDDGWLVALRSADQEPEPETQIYVADLEGEMGLWLRLSPVCFIGETLCGGGQTEQDPYQATSLGSAVLHGPNFSAYSANYSRLHAADAARLVENDKDLSRELESLLAPNIVAEMARAAWDVSTSGAEVSDRIQALIFDALTARGI